jgi:hypothetical protein
MQWESDPRLNLDEGDLEFSHWQPPLDESSLEEVLDLFPDDLPSFKSTDQVSFLQDKSN